MYNLPTLVTGNVLSLADKDSININGTIHKQTVKYESTLKYYNNKIYILQKI